MRRRTCAPSTVLTCGDIEAANARRFAQRHAGQLNPHGRLCRKGCGNTAPRHQQIVHLPGQHATIRNFVILARIHVNQHKVLFVVDIDGIGRLRHRVLKAAPRFNIFFRHDVFAVQPIRLANARNIRKGLDIRFLKAGEALFEETHDPHCRLSRIQNHLRDRFRIRGAGDVPGPQGS